MADRELRVRISLDVSALRSDTDAAAAAFEGIGTAAERAALAAERAAERAAITAENAAERAAVAQERAAGRAADEVSRDARRASEAQEREARQAADEVGRQARRAAEEQARAERQAEEHTRQTWANRAKVAALAVAAGAVLAAKSVLTQGIDYEQSLNQLGAVTGASAAQMKTFGETARALGNDLELPTASASDAASAMLELAKGGLTAQESLESAKGTLTLAAAAQISGAEAAQIQSAALNTFNLSASDAAHVADVLANVANASSGEITDFASGMAQAGLVAHSMGISLDDTATVLGIFAKQGLSGSDAGTSFKTMLVSLQSPSDTAAAALEELGIKAYDAQGNFVGMRVVTDQLATAQKNMTTEQFNAAASTAFGTDAVRAAVAMAAEGVTGFDSMGTSVRKSGGATDVAAAQTKGLQGALNNAENALSDIALTVYDKYSPAITDMVNDAAAALPAIAGFFMGVFDAVGSFVGVILSAPGPVLAISGALLGVALLRGPLNLLWTSIVSGAQTAYLSFLTAGAGATGMAGMMNVARAAAIGLRTSLKAVFLSNPIGIAIIAVTTAIALFTSAANKNKEALADQKRYVDQLTGSIDEQSGAWTELSRKAVQDRIGELGEGKLQSWYDLGIAVGDATEQILGNTEAQHRNEAALTTAAATAIESTDTWRNYSKVLTAAGISADDLGVAVLNGDFSSVNAQIAAYNTTLGEGDTRITAFAKGNQAAEMAMNDLYAAAGPMRHAYTDLNALTGQSITSVENYTIAQGELKASTDAVGQAAVAATPGVKELIAGFDQTKFRNSADAAAALGLALAAIPEIDVLTPAFDQSVYRNSADAAAAAGAGMSSLSGAVNIYNAATKDAAASTDALTLSMQLQAGKNVDAEVAQRNNAAAMREVASSARDVADANQNYADKEQDVADALAEYGENSAEYAQATRDQADAADAVRDAEDGRSESQDKAAASAFLLTDQAIRLAAANGTQEQAIQAGIAVMTVQRQSFIDSAMAAGYSREEAEKLATAQGLIPENVRTTYEQNGYQAMIDGAVTLKSKLDGLDGRRITITFDQTVYRNSADAVTHGATTAPGSALGGNVAETMMRGFSGGGPIGGAPAPANPMQDNLLARDDTGRPLMVRGDEWVINGPVSTDLGPQIMSNFNAGLYGKQFFTGTPMHYPGSGSGGGTGSLENKIDRLAQAIEAAGGIGGNRTTNIQAGDSVAAVYSALQRVNA